MFWARQSHELSSWVFKPPTGKMYEMNLVLCHPERGEGSSLQVWDSSLPDCVAIEKCFIFPNLIADQALLSPQTRSGVQCYFNNLHLDAGSESGMTPYDILNLNNIFWIVTQSGSEGSSLYTWDSWLCSEWQLSEIIGYKIKFMNSDNDGSRSWINWDSSVR